MLLHHFPAPLSPTVSVSLCDLFRVSKQNPAAGDGLEAVDSGVYAPEPMTKKGGLSVFANHV